MNKKLLRTAALVLALSLFAGLFSMGVARADGSQLVNGKIVVANRGSGNISVIDAGSGQLFGSFMLPQSEGENTPEPMYVVYTRYGNHVFVGDRANDRVVVFDADDFSVTGMVPAGRGVFHMWADQLGKQLWVNNDIDNTSTVIDPKTLSVLATVPTPADLVAMGGFPHDVILDPTGKLAYISVLGLPGEHDAVVQFSTDTFEETNRAAVGKDPHLSLTKHNKLLYVPCQGSNAVFILDRGSLEQVGMLSIPGAHGAGMTFNGRYFYTTNLPGGGTDAIFTIDTMTNTVLGEPVDTPYSVPHNIALTKTPDKLFLTHSGPNDKVTFYNVSNRDPIPVFAGEVTVGMNPFGLSYVP